jgi:dephospho-CoA kinase
VHDSDAAVHRLYAGEAVAPVEAAFPGIASGGRIDRAQLAARVLADPGALARLEAIVHPLVRASEDVFLARARSAGRRRVLLDIPLLFESARESDLDVIVVVTADADTQRRRVLARPGMTEGRFAAISARQLPDGEKRQRAHFLVDTGYGLAPAERQVAAILRALASAA